MQTPPSFSVPVAPQLPPPMTVRFAAIGEAWDLIRQDWVPWVLSILVLIVGSYAAEFLALPFFMLIGLAGVGSSQTSAATGVGLAIGFVLVYILTFVAVSVVQGVMFTLPQRLAVRRLRGLSSTTNDLFAL